MSYAGGTYEKQPGKSAHVTGSVVRAQAGRFDLDELYVRIGK